MYRAILLFCTLLISFSISYSQNSKVEGLLYSDGKPVSITIADGKISEIKQIQGDSKSDIYVAPGFIDLQLNGYMGVDFADQHLTAEDMKKAIKSVREKGVTTFLPTIVTADFNQIKRSFELLSGMLKDPEIAVSIPGFHLEGPYISPVEGFRGAHPANFIRKPNLDELNELLQASHHNIKLLTLAPELKGSIPFIRKCIENHIVVSLGHHNGTAAQIDAAVDAGATLSTHLGNGCANMINRHLNPLWPQLANDRLNISIICDGFHLTKDEIRTFYKVKGPQKTILVSDAVYLAGMTPGTYKKGAQTFVLSPENVVQYPADNVLAGSATNLSICVGNIMRFTGCSLADAVQMATANPAKLISLNDRGEIKEGKRADLVLFRIENNKLEILKTIVAGKVVYAK